MSATRQGTDSALGAERVRLGGIDTRILSSDLSGGEPPFLFVHGFADSADTWRPLMERLAEAGRPAMALDLGGFGTARGLDRRSDALPQWDRMVADAALRLSESAGSDVYIAGNSLGGCLALRAAERSDLPVAGVVPIAPAGLDMARWLQVIEGERLIRLLRLSPVPVPELAVREVIGRVYANLAFSSAGRASSEAVASFTRHIPSVKRGSEILDTGRRMLPELENPFRLERIDCPLLLVWGENDRLVYTTGAERVLRTVPYSDIEIIAGVGHCPQLEVPEQMAELLLEFPREDLGEGVTA